MKKKEKQRSRHGYRRKERKGHNQFEKFYIT